MNLEPEDHLTDEQEARVSRLTPQEVSQIDAALMSHAVPQWRKVAMIVGLAMQESKNQPGDVPDVFYSRRVAHLVSDGKLVAFGDLRRMRYSEVKLP